MPARREGTVAPQFSLPDADGKELSLAENLKRGLVVLAFLKVSCPTCQFAFPFIDRIFRAYAGRANMVGISQDPPNDTKLFTSTFDVSMPMLFDPPEAYPVSNAYGIMFVPTIFLISSDGRIELSSEGWVRAEIEQLNQALAKALGAEPARIFEEDEDVPDFRAGCGAMN